MRNKTPRPIAAAPTAAAARGSAQCHPCVAAAAPATVTSERCACCGQPAVGDQRVTADALTDLAFENRQHREYDDRKRCHHDARGQLLGVRSLDESADALDQRE